MTDKITIKIDLNDYLIPATQCKRLKNKYYIRFEEEYTGDLTNPREKLYTLEFCRGKKGDKLVSWWNKRSYLHNCWIVKDEMNLHETWDKSGLSLENSFAHVDKETVKKFMEEALLFH